jgi:hypothetical protein
MPFLKKAVFKESTLIFEIDLVKFYKCEEDLSYYLLSKIAVFKLYKKDYLQLTVK